MQSNFVNFCKKSQPLFALSLLMTNIHCGGNKKADSNLNSEAPAMLSLRSEPAGSSLRYPLVIVNGMISSGETLQPVVEALRKDGHKVFLIQTPAAHSLATRSKSLLPQIDEIFAKTDAEKINMLGYSLGVLDARFMISRLGYASKVASLTSVSGPNSGTPAATTAFRIMNELPKGWQSMMETFVGMIGAKILNPLLADPELKQLAYDLSVEGVSQFNLINPDIDGVHYQALAALSTPSGELPSGAQEICGKLVTEKQIAGLTNSGLTGSMRILAPDLKNIPSDGAIPVESQKLGYFRGCVPTDHWGIIGAEVKPGPDPRTGFELISFYRHVAYDLSRQGF